MEKLRLGGMALQNGVLVHGPTSWGAAVRLPDGSIKTAFGPKPRLGARVTIPFVRGPLRLAEAFAVLPVVKRELPEARMPFERPAVAVALLAASTGASVARRSALPTVPREAVVLLASLAPALVALRGQELTSYHGAEHVSIGTYETGERAAKERLRAMAEGLIALAAKRALRETDAVTPPPGLFAEFCARFPYEETDDQLNAIGDVLEDLGKGTPMDRLICGDVGFGKTEVALRAAFVVAMTGKQVAIVCPTTLLSRQHFKTFSERFHGWPIRVRSSAKRGPGSPMASRSTSTCRSTISTVRRSGAQQRWSCRSSARWCTSNERAEIWRTMGS